MPEEAEAGAASAAPLYEDLVPRDCLVYSALGQIDPEYHVLAFVFEESEPIPIILVSEVNSQLLVAIPGAAWHRTSRLRKLPPQSLSKVQAVAALAVPEGDRQVSSEGIYIKIWLGLLKPEFEECLDLTAALASPAFPTETGAEGFLPYAQSLVTLADDKYSFVSAESAVPQEEVGHRLLTLEENLKQMAESMQQFMSQYQDQGSSSSFVKATSKAAPKPAAPPDLSGLDPQVLRGALQAGVPRSQLEEFAKLIGGRKPKMSDVPGLKNPHLSKTDVLGETDEDEEPEESGLAAASPEELNDPVKAALLKLTKIVDVLASSSKKKTKAILEDGLDDSGVWSEGASSSTSLGGQGRRHAALLQTLQKAFREAPQDIYAVLEKRMLDDFGSPEQGPGQPSRSGTYRGWAEHRSRIQNFGPTVRVTWAVCGALDALRNGRVPEAQMRLILLLAQLDQVSIDRGQWVLAGEGSLEQPPPFSSFSHHSLPDYLEQQHTRLWPQAWAEALMWRVRELDDFVERRSKLGQRSSARSQGQAEEKNQNQRQKGKGKGKQKQQGIQKQEETATGGGGQS